MKSRGITQEKLCNDLEISKSAFIRKCNGRSEFTLKEINQIVAYLGLGTPMDIFFADKVS